MKGLLLETSQSPSQVGLAEEGEITLHHLLEGGKPLTGKLFPLLAELLAIQEISYIAFGVGPGSFIGMRTAATVASTLAYARKIPLIPFSSPLALLPKGHEGTFAFLGDAKMGRTYLITGEVGHNGPAKISPPKLLQTAEIDPSLYDFVVSPSHLTPEPNLKWVAPYALEQYSRGKSSQSLPLELAYLTLKD